jgi:outer membrane protein assembly factor BamB
MQSTSSFEETPAGSPIGDRVAAGAFCVGLVLLGFVAGSFVMVRETSVAQPIRQAYQGGFALYDKLTRYQDPLDTDLWRPARTDARGVTIHDPSQAQAGLTLYTSGHEQRAFLIDMDGRVVHEWALPFSKLWDKSSPIKAPQADDYVYIEKAHVLPNGDLLALYVAVGDTPWGYGLAKLDANSNVVWKYMGHAHHDFDLDDAGNVYVLTQEISSKPLPGYEYLRPPRIDDFLVKLSPDGQELNKVWLTGSVAESAAGRRLNMAPWYAREGSGDYLHTNSVDVLTAPLRGVAASKPGQALLSFRELNTVGLVDIESGKLVWASTGSWLRQHDAEGLPNGDIMLFDNEGGFENAHGVSRVLEFRPDTQEIVWSYAGTQEHPFESIVRSSESRLPNGNTLIVESDAGRVLEVTRSGQIVWEFVNPARGGKDNERIPIIFWVQRMDPDSYFEPGFRTQLTGAATSEAS